MGRRNLHRHSHQARSALRGLMPPSSLIPITPFGAHYQPAKLKTGLAGKPFTGSGHKSGRPWVRQGDANPGLGGLKQRQGRNKTKWHNCAVIVLFQGSNFLVPEF